MTTTNGTFVFAPIHDTFCSAATKTRLSLSEEKQNQQSMDYHYYYYLGVVLLYYMLCALYI